MRPASVYAKRSCPAGCPCDLLGLLHGPHRVGVRLVMILLSQQRWTPTAIAELLGCDPRTVRRWVHRYNQHGTSGLTDRPRPGRPRPGTNRRRTIFGAVDLASGRFCYQVARKAISATFTAFQAHVLAAYPTAPVVAVACHNVPIHRSKLVQRWLATPTPGSWCCTAPATVPTTTRSSASGARSRHGWRTRRR
jgi:hypothetical protein